MERIPLIPGGRTNLKPRKMSIRISLFIVVLLLAFACSLMAGTGYKLYVTHPLFYQDGNSALSIVNLENGLKISQKYTVQTGEKVVYSEKTGSLYVFSSLKNICEVYNPIIDIKLFEFNTGGPIADVVFSPDGKYMYIANGGNSNNAKNTVTVIETETGSQLYSISVGKIPTALEISPDGSLLFVADKQLGVINVVELVNFQLLRSFYAGVAPTDLELSWDGRFLLAASANIPFENGRGAGFAVISLSDESVKSLIPTDGDVNKILMPNGNSVVTMEILNGSSLIKTYNYINDFGTISASLANTTTINSIASDIFATFDGKLLVSTGNTSNPIRIFSLSNFSEKKAITDLFYDKVSSLAVIQIDYDKKLNIRDSVIAADPAGNPARNAYFEKAYLHRCMGEKNSEIRIYNELAQQYPGSQTEILSLLRLGDLCYDDLLYANSADFYTRAYKAYAQYLIASSGKNLIDDNVILPPIERMGEFSVRNDKDYLKVVFSGFEALTVSSPQLAEMEFMIAYYLKKQGDSKLARRCIDEVERQMMHFTDKNLYKSMRDRIDLLNGEGRVVLSANKIKQGPAIDGDPEDWKDKHTLIIDRRTDMLVNNHRWIDENDLAVEFRTAYDKNNFYILGLVTDNKLFNADDTKRDKFIIYIDTHEESGDFLNRKREIDDDVISMVVLPPVDERGKFQFEHSRRIQPIFAGLVNERGYSFEIKIPFVYLNNIKPDSKTKFGFGFEAWDADSDMPKDPLKIMGWVAPTGTIDGDRNRPLFGILEF
jgi:YVTN family beta-propeller protein